MVGSWRIFHKHDLINSALDLEYGYIITSVTKGIKNVHCGDQRHLGLCLGRRPCTSRNRFEIYGSALELIFISLCTGANAWMFDSVYINGNQMKLFQ